MLFHQLTIDRSAQLNDALYEQFVALRNAGRVRQSHFLAGRFENTYVDETDIPEIGVVLDVLRQQAALLLGVPAESLRAGFWFNAMEAGHRTELHHHDENDELLSAAYYIRVPENSGDLVLYDGESKVSICPQEGGMVLFAPSVPHEVTVHRGQGLRLSVGMNVGPAAD